MVKSTVFLLCLLFATCLFAQEDEPLFLPFPQEKNAPLNSAAIVKTIYEARLQQIRDIATPSLLGMKEKREIEIELLRFFDKYWVEVPYSTESYIVMEKQMNRTLSDFMDEYSLRPVNSVIDRHSAILIRHYLAFSGEKIILNEDTHLYLHRAIYRKIDPQKRNRCVHVFW